MKIPRFITPTQQSSLRKKIVKSVYSYFDIPEESMYVRCKKPGIVYPRQLAAYLLISYRLSKPGDIAFIVGGFDRRTIYHYYEVICRRADVEEQVQEDIKNIKLLIDQQ